MKAKVEYHTLTSPEKPLIYSALTLGQAPRLASATLVGYSCRAGRLRQGRSLHLFLFDIYQEFDNFNHLIT